MHWKRLVYSGKLIVNRQISGIMDLRNYRHPGLIKEVLQDVVRITEQNSNRPVRFMEVCGSHTMAIGEWGIRRLLPDTIKLISGPGCPVCVTPSSVIDELMRLRGVTVAVFGDLMRVPGSKGTLEQARAKGARVRTVYSPLEALDFARQEETILVGIGFETTIPGIAYTLSEAYKRKMNNFSLLSLMKLVPPALEALLSDNDVKVDGFILPGHVSAIIGTRAYSFLTERYKTGGVVSGFEPLDIVLAIKKLLEQLSQPQIINEYSRVVTVEGNQEAKTLMKRVFRVTDALWRGIGELPESGLEIREEFADFDAKRKHRLRISDLETNSSCRCSDVLKGKIIPRECPLFEVQCTPESPVGPCMVSSEGSCAAYYRYER